MSKLDAEVIQTVCDADESKVIQHLRKLNTVEDMEIRYAFSRKFLD